MILDLKEIKTIADFETILMHNIDKKEPSAVGLINACNLFNVAVNFQKPKHRTFPLPFLVEDLSLDAISENHTKLSYEKVINRGFTLNPGIEKIWNTNLYELVGKDIQEASRYTRLRVIRIISSLISKGMNSLGDALLKDIHLSKAPEEAKKVFMTKHSKQIQNNITALQIMCMAEKNVKGDKKINYPEMIKDAYKGKIHKIYRKNMDEIMEEVEEDRKANKENNTGLTDKELDILYKDFKEKQTLNKELKKKNPSYYEFFRSKNGKRMFSTAMNDWYDKNPNLINKMLKLIMSNKCKNKHLFKEKKQYKNN